jgi:hypothetical protein
VRDTQRTLELAREALLGFAASNGRLPCPAQAPPPPLTAPGPFAVEAFVDPVIAPPARDLRCAAGSEGFLPAITLGIGPTDRYGYLLDAWGNPIRYAVSDFLATPPAVLASCPPNVTAPAVPDFTKCPAFTTSNAVLTLGFAALPNSWTPVLPATSALLRVCTISDCSTGPIMFTPALVWSPGKNFQAVGAPSADEQANATVVGDRTFVFREPSPAGSAAGEFDDLVIWIPAAVLYGRLIAAGGV